MMKQFWNRLGDKQKPLFLFGLATVIALVVAFLTLWMDQADEPVADAGTGNAGRRGRGGRPHLGDVADRRHD